MVKAGVNPEILENIAPVTFNDNSTVYIKVYISGMEISQRNQF